MKKHIKKICQCPHWIDEEDHHVCHISMGGVFIPLPQHIDTFCLSEEYQKCSYYMKAVEHLQEPELVEKNAVVDRRANKKGAVGDRRANRRIGCTYSLLFSPLEKMGLSKEGEQKEAESIDISLGGMQISSYKEIPQQQMMAFSFGSDLEEARSIAGIGEVQWCRETSGHGYLAGVSFVFLDDDMKAELRNRIFSP